MENIHKVSLCRNFLKMLHLHMYFTCIDHLFHSKAFSKISRFPNKPGEKPDCFIIFLKGFVKRDIFYTQQNVHADKTWKSEELPIQCLCLVWIKSWFSNLNKQLNLIRSMSTELIRSQLLENDLAFYLQ